MNAPVKKILFICFFFYSAFFFGIESSTAKDATINATENKTWSPLFPAALFLRNMPPRSIGTKKAIIPSREDIEKEYQKREESLQSVLLNNDIFALYGKPNAYTMGILGQYSLENIEPIMNEFVKIYDDANGDRGVIPAFYIIYGTCWPEGEIGYLSKKITEQYIEFAATRGWYVFIDHQIGKYTVEQAMNTILPFLKYPNVHLAIDPEWRTTKPMRVIGYVTGEEVNTAQKMMQDYIIKHNIFGRKMLVIHQFNAKMIARRNLVKSNYERVQLIHCADGFGPPRLKRESYAYNALAKNIPLKSFKLFLKPTVAGAGYDQPLMTPKDVFNLHPRPYLIMYQ
ncbi:hypothetical protein DWQ65_06760 [Treponema phagedenis]|uniref:Lipoprotein n=1 Tax=Treponema phagedenis TaxID=162 RepID=A0A0B7GPJ5_TREPH|nr:hypothetical protein [Treponema phagedenis]EFW37097.1 hypothetical protein HMPREF9554_02405 [Treponema phagedenis F0421]QSH93490.1 hypothetical protein C5O78_00175 [Treponema phagedenis]QSH99766.1 hypothetical protein DWQ65_06760 [Treponema phagedenis]CEM60368.1 conserved exported hypothetical protein [Treponema phagedenis]